MKAIAAAALLLLLSAIAACSGPSPSPSASLPAGGAIGTAEQATIAAERLATITGPWTIGDVQHGTYERLWQGSTNDLSGQAAADSASKNRAIVWRVDLVGPTGSEQLYLDETDGRLLDAITQGN